MSNGTLILALGNPLRGDDGVGAAVLKALAACDLPADVTLLDGGTPGLETVLLMQDRTRVIVIDAAEMGKPPGEWRCFQRDDVLPRDLALRGTLHYAGLAEALALGDALGLLPPGIAIYGIQPEEIGWEPGLSEPVAAAVESVARAVLEHL